jgi:hypothetical protein
MNAPEDPKVPVGGWFGAVLRRRVHRHRRPSSSRGRGARIRRLAQWNSLGFLVLCGIGLLWWASDHLRQATGKADYSPPLESVPKPTKEVDDINEIVKQGYAPDLEGTIFVYWERLNALVRSDGSIRTDLSLHELARITGVKWEAIAKRGSTTEIDPSAVLFTVIIARQSERSKSQARQLREKQARLGMPRSAVGDEWVRTTAAFSLSDLRNPGPEQKQILEAISRKKLTPQRQPGAKINAVASPTAPEVGELVLFGGDLPLEAHSSLSGQGSAAVQDQ